MSEVLSSLKLNMEYFFQVLNLIFEQAQQYTTKHEDEKLYLSFIIQIFKMLNLVFGFKCINHFGYLYSIDEKLANLMTFIKEKNFSNLSLENI
jgi:hypothetical protein